GLYFFFFFSSRRRHTRSDRDWSSDVCSSDLGTAKVDRLVRHYCFLLRVGWQGAAGVRVRLETARVAAGDRHADLVPAVEDDARRSEERRVGKECRKGWVRVRCKEERRTE